LEPYICLKIKTNEHLRGIVYTKGAQVSWLHARAVV